jgi:hypothetical protein
MAQSVQITTDKTTSLIFPFSIRHVDRGTKDILVQPVKESDNILLVKAAVKDFSPTNLSVVTTDGSMYSFSVQYAVTPNIWVYQVPPQKRASLETYANSILDNPLTMRGIHDYSWEVEGRITGIYIKDQVIYYQLRLNNQSPIDYDIDFLRFYIRDKRKGKRTATQENEIKPLYVAGNTSQVKANSQTTVVVALEKFTIPDAKYLAVEINEKNGGRHLQLKIGNRKIVKARPLSALH